MNRKFSTRALTEGAIMAALTALLGVLSYYIPFLTLFIFIWPIPIIILGKRQGVSISFIASLIAGILVSLFTPIIFAMQVVIMYGLLGVALGYAYQKKMSITKTMLLGYITSLISIVVLLQFYNVITGIDIITEFTEMMKMSIDEVTRMYQSFGIDPDSLKQTTDRMNSLIDSVIILFPGVLLIMPIITTGINMLVAQKMLSRLGYDVVKILPLRNWKLPTHASYGLLFIIAITALGQYLNISNFDIVYQNVVYLILMVFFVQGLAVVAYYFYGKRLSKGIKFLGYVSILVFPLLQMMVHFIGLFDVLFNFRERIKFRQD